MHRIQRQWENESEAKTQRTPKHFLRNLPIRSRCISRSLLGGSAHASSRRCFGSEERYVPIRLNAKVVSGFITSPFISSSGYTRKLIGPLSGSGSTTRSRPFVSSKRLAGL